MPAFEKAPPEVIERFQAVVPPGAQVKKMFGMPAAFLGGNIFAGVFADSIVVRLGDADRAAAFRAGATPFEPTSGRVMKEYAQVRGTLLADRFLEHLIERAAAHAADLPPKAPKATKAGKKTR